MAHHRGLPRCPGPEPAEGDVVARLLLFHHAQGLTPGVESFASTLREAGHVVHTPDLLEGRSFDSVEAGVAHAETVGFDVIVERGVAAAEVIPAVDVLIGMSLGAMPAQQLAHSRGDVRAGVFLHSCVAPWPERIPLQIHVMDGDEWGDVDDARALAASQEGVELFLYPGDRHLFSDASVADHDPPAAELLTTRVLEFLERF